MTQQGSTPLRTFLERTIVENVIPLLGTNIALDTLTAGGGAYEFRNLEEIVESGGYIMVYLHSEYFYESETLALLRSIFNVSGYYTLVGVKVSTPGIVADPFTYWDIKVSWRKI